MFSIEFCFFLATGGHFVFKDDYDRNINHGFTLKKRARFLQDGIPFQYETLQEWQARQNQSLKYFESMKASKIKDSYLILIKNRVYLNRITLSRRLTPREGHKYKCW